MYSINVCWVSEWVSEGTPASSNSIFIKHCHRQHESLFPPSSLYPWEGKWLLIQGSAGVMMEVARENSDSWALHYWEITPSLCVRVERQGVQDQERGVHTRHWPEPRSPPRQRPRGCFPKLQNTMMSLIALWVFTPEQEKNISTQLMFGRDCNCMNKIAVFLGNCHWQLPRTKSKFPYSQYWDCKAPLINTST